MYVKLDGTCSNILLSDDKSDNSESTLLSGTIKMKEYAFIIFILEKYSLFYFSELSKEDAY